MEVISEQMLRSLGLSPLTCVAWIKESCALKAGAELPVKSAVKPSPDEFFTSMPCLPPPYTSELEGLSGFERRY